MAKQRYSWVFVKRVDPVFRNLSRQLLSLGKTGPKGKYKTEKSKIVKGKVDIFRRIRL